MTWTAVASVVDVKRRHESRLMKMRGVVGVGIGQKDGKECICIYVEEDNPKIRSVLPESLDEVPVEVIVRGNFKALRGAMMNVEVLSGHHSWRSGPGNG